MLQGLTTVSFYADDVAEAARWYARLLGVQPYFSREVEGRTVYAEFRLGTHQDELGLIDARFRPGDRPTAPGGAIVYWHVDDVEESVRRLLDAGATIHEPVSQRGPGFVTASVVDPFGNVLGVMFNQHYVDESGA